MGLTQVNSDSIKDGEVKTADIADQAVDLTKLPHGDGTSDGKFLRSNNGADPTWVAVSSTPEGEAVLSTTNGNEANTKFLRADGDGTCSWQTPPSTTINNATANELVTVASTTTQLDAESKLTFDGTNLFVGGGSSRTVAGNSHKFVIEDTGAAPSTAMAVISNTNGADGPAIRLGKTRATSLGGNTGTNTDDNLGQIEWLGNDGSSLRCAGRLRVKQESDTDTNSVPGYMQFMVTGDGQTNPYEHMRLRAGPTGTDGRLIIAPPISQNGSATDGLNQGEINLSNWNINQDDRYARIYSYNSGNNYTIGVKFQSGKTGTTWMNIKGNAEIDGNFNDTSDIALKENVVALSSTWNAVKQLKPCTFDWKPQTDVKDSSKVIVDGWSSVGFIAQEVESVIPLLVSGKDGEKSINTIGLVSQLTKALQEAMTKIETLETKVAALEAT